MENSSNNARITYIDIAKGFGIVFVVIGHSLRDEMLLNYIGYDYIYSIIYFFHMPLFFTISGYLMEHSFCREEKPLKLIIKKTKTLLIPFIIYSLLIFIIFRVACMLPGIGTILAASIDTDISLIKYILLAVMGNNPLAFHLWYLIVLFLIELFTIISVLVIKGNRMQVTFIISSIIYFLSMYVDFFNLSTNYNTINAVFRYIVFFSFGQMLFYNEKVNRKGDIYNSYIITIASFAGFFMATFSFIIKRNSMVQFNSLQKLLYTTLVLIGRFLLIYSIFGVSKKIKKSNILSILGQESYNIYLMHQPFICAFLGTVLYGKLRMPAQVVIIICAVLSLAIPISIVRFIKKFPNINYIMKKLLNIG